MWTVKCKRIGERDFFEVRNETASGDSTPRGGIWETEAEAQRLADNLNKEDGYYERIQ